MRCLRCFRLATHPVVLIGLVLFALGTKIVATITGMIIHQPARSFKPRDDALLLPVE